MTTSNLPSSNSYPNEHVVETSAAEMTGPGLTERMRRSSPPNIRPRRRGLDSNPWQRRSGPHNLRDQLPSKRVAAIMHATPLTRRRTREAAPSDYYATLCNKASDAGARECGLTLRTPPS